MPLIQSVQEQEKKKNKQQAASAPVTRYKAPVTGADPTRTTGRYNAEHGYKRPSMGSGSVQQYNYSSTPRNQWNAAQYCAYGRMTGNQSVFDDLATRTDIRGDQYYNPYRAGRSTVPEYAESELRRITGYTGKFDDKFFQDYAYLLDNLEYNKYTNSAKSPSKKSTDLQRAAYAYNAIAQYQKESQETNDQYAEYRSKLQDFANQFTKINGRQPTLEEFAAAVDSDKYSRLKAINESLPINGKYLDEKTTQVLVYGTYYSPDTIAGLYHAWANGADITNDRDYFEDAVQYYMNPVQNAPANRQYDWSGSDLSQWSPEDQQKYLSRLNAEGKREEYAAFKWACWAAQPHDDNISVEPSMLDSNFGSYHDDNFFKGMYDAIGDEMDKRRLADGTMPSSLKTKGDLMDRTCYEAYELEKLRGATDDAENAYKDVLSQIQEIFQKFAEEPDFEWTDYADFHDTVMEKLALDKNSDLQSYLKHADDPAYIAGHFCRDMPFISADNIDACIRRVWDDKPINPEVDYTVQVDYDHEPPYAHDVPVQEPYFYNQNQARLANQRYADNNNAVKAMTDAVVEWAASGAVIPQDSVPVYSEQMLNDMIASGSTDKLAATVAGLWAQNRKAELEEKLGPNFTAEAAAAVDPVLNLLHAEMPDAINLHDVFDLCNMYYNAKAQTDDVGLIDGIIHAAIPGVEKLYDKMLDNYADYRIPEWNDESDWYKLGVPLKTFDQGVYKATYNSYMEKGFSENDAVDIAAFAATDMNDAAKRIAATYEGDEEITAASNKLVADIAAEDGAMDSVELFKAINDDVSKVVGNIRDKAIHDVVPKLNEALLLGASEEASLGFRALTNDVIQGIASGDITGEDVVAGMAASEGIDTSGWGELAPYEGEAKIADAADVFAASDTRYANAEEELKAAYQSTKKFIYSGGAYDNLSQEALQATGMDKVIERGKAAYGENWEFVKNDVLQEAVENYLNRDRMFNTSDAMNGRTDFMGELQQMIGATDEQQVGVNQINRNASWVEQLGINDRTGLTDALAAYTHFGDERSDQARAVHLLRAFGKYLSYDEMIAGYNAFTNGMISYDQLSSLVKKRQAEVDQATPGYANAVQNEKGLEKSISGLRYGIEHINVEQQTYDEYLATNITSDPTMLMSKQDFEAQQKKADYTDEQIAIMSDFVDAMEKQGALGYTFATLDNDVIKTITGIDIQAAGFDSAMDMLDRLSPNWAKPYGENPGYQWGLFESVARGMGEGVAAITKMPAYMANAVREVCYFVCGEDYDYKTATGFLSGAYRNIKELEEETQTEQQQTATTGEQFVQQGISEVVRNLGTSSLGGLAQKGMSMTAGEELTMINASVPVSPTQGIVNIAEAENGAKAFLAMYKAIGRTPFGVSVLVNALDEKLSRGDSVPKALALAAADAMIEMFTEDLPLEKFNVLGDHARNYASTAGSQAMAWCIRSVNGMIEEIGEEEASELLQRMVDTIVGQYEGQGFVDSLTRSFEGYGDAAKQTALATAFTTLMFSAMDLGGTMADYVEDCMAGRIRMTAEEYTNRIVTDAQTRAAGLTSEQIAAKEAKGVQKYTAYNPATQVPQWGSNAQASSEALQGTSEQTSPEGTQNTSEAVEPSETKQNQPETASVSDSEQETGPETVKAQQQVHDAVKAYAKDPSEESLKKVDKIAQEFQKSVDKDDEAKAQEQAEEATEAAQEPVEEPVQPNLTPGAQKVKNMMDASEQAKDDAIVTKAAQMAAEKAIAEDNGIKAKQAALEKAQLKVQEGEQKVAALQQQIQTIANQTIQGLRALADEGIDPESGDPRAQNLRVSKAQQRSATEAEAAETKEKTDALAKQVAADEKKLEDDKAAITEEIQQRVAEKTQKRLEELKAKMFEEKSAEARLKEIDNVTQQELNKRQAEADNLEVHSLFTNEQGEQNRQAVQAEQENKIGTYQDIYKAGGATSEVAEGYVNPATYRSRANVSDVRSEEWQDEAKHTEDARIEYEEREARLLGDFTQYRQQTAPIKYLPVSREIYDLVVEKTRDEENTAYADARWVKRVNDDNEPAQIDIVNADKKQGDNSIDRDIAQAHRIQEPTYSAGDLQNDDGSLTGLGQHILEVADPDFIKNVAVSGVKGNSGTVGIVMNHVTENNRYLVLQPSQTTEESADPAFDAMMYKELTKKKSPYIDATGKRVMLTGLQITERQIAELQTSIQKTQDRIAKDTAREAELKTARENTTDEDALKKINNEMSNVLTDRRLAQNTLNNYQAQLYGEGNKPGLLEKQANALDFIANFKKNKGKAQNLPAYYVFDKKALEDTNPELIYQQAIDSTVKRLAAEIPEGTKRGEMIEKIKAMIYDDVGSFEGEDEGASFSGMLNQYLTEMSDEELDAKMYDMVFQREKDRLLNEAYAKAVQVIRDDGEAFAAAGKLDEFVNSHGGYAHADKTYGGNAFGGAGFRRFTDAKYYNPREGFMISEEAGLKYLTPEQQEEIGLNVTSAQYNARLNGNIRDFAEQNGLSQGDIDILQNHFNNRKEDPKKIGSATIVHQDGTHFLGVPHKFAEDFTKNKFLKVDQSYSVSKAKEELASRLKYIANVADAIANGYPIDGAEPKLDTEKHNIRAYFYDEKGKDHSFVVGELYKFPNGEVKRFIPSYETLMNSAWKIVCNFPGYTDGRKMNPNLSFTLFQNSETQENMIDTEAAMNYPDFEQPESLLNSTLGRETIEANMQRFESLIYKLSLGDNNGELYWKAVKGYVQSMYDEALGDLRNALSETVHATPDTLTFWRGEAALAQAKLDAIGEEFANVSKEYSKYEKKPEEQREGYGSATDRGELSNLLKKRAKAGLSEEKKAAYDKRIDELKKKIKAETKEVKVKGGTSSDRELQLHKNKEQAPWTPPKSSAEIYQRAKDRYDYLTQNRAVVEERKKAIDESHGRFPHLASEEVQEYERDKETYHDHEIAMLAALLPDLKRFADEEAQQAAKAQPEPASDKPKVAMPNITAIANDLDGAQKLVFLKDLENNGIDVGDMRKQAIQAYHDNLTKDMSDIDKAAYYANLASLQKSNPNAFTIDPDANYDSMIGDIVMKNLANQDRKILKDIDNILAKAPNRNKGWITRDMKKLAAYEQQGYDVSAARDALEKRMTEIMTPQQAVKEQAIENEPDPEVKKTLQLMGAETQEELHDAIMSDMPDAIRNDQEEIYDDEIREILNPTQEQTTEEVTEEQTTEEQPVQQTEATVISTETEQIVPLETSTRTKMSELETTTTTNRNGESTVTAEEQPAPTTADNMLDRMQEPAPSGPNEEGDVNTGFNDMVEAFRTAAQTISNEDEYNAAMEQLANVVQRVKDLNSDIDKALNKVAYNSASRELASNRARELMNSTGSKFSDDASSKQHDKLVKKFNAVFNQIAETDKKVREEGATAETTDMLNALSRDLIETRQALQALEDMSGGKWTDEQRREYGELLNQLGYIDKDITKHKNNANTLIEERDAAKQERDRLSYTLDVSPTAQRMTHNRTTWNKSEFEGKNQTQIFTGRLSRAKRAADKATKIADKMGLFKAKDRSVMSTVNMAKVLKGNVINDDAIMFNRLVSWATGNGLKEAKRAIILLNYGLQMGDYKQGKLTADQLEEKAKKARKDLFDMNYLTGYSTEEDVIREKRARQKAFDAVEDYTDKLSKEILTGNIEHAMNLLRYQRDILQNEIEQASKTVRDYYSLSSTDSIQSALDGDDGGHLPQVVMDFLVGCVHNSMTKKNGNLKKDIGLIASGNRLFRAFDTVVCDTLGKYAPWVNSILYMPVMQKEGEAAAWHKGMMQRLDEVALSNNAAYEALGHVLDKNLTNAEIKAQYPEYAKELIRAKPVYQDVLKETIINENIALTRNGLEAIFDIKNYFPHQRQTLNKFYRFFGIDPEGQKLPTGLLGETSDTTPGSPFASHTLHREDGSREGIDWNARRVLERHLDAAKAIIYQSDNLMRINDFIDALTGGKEHQNPMNKSDRRSNNAAYSATSPLDYNTLGEMTGKDNYQLFINALKSWRDQVAGKKTGQLDRLAEKYANRGALTAIQLATKLQGAAKVGGNIKTCILNCVPVTTCMAMHPIDSTIAIKDVVDCVVHGQDLFEHPALSKSQFFKARCLNNRSAVCTFDKITGKLFVPLEVTDRLSTAATWLGNYYHWLKQYDGDEAQAAIMADSMTATIMSSKIRGGKGEAYNSTVGGMVLQFTQEAVNQIGVMSRDIWKYNHGAVRAIASLLATFLGGFVINRLGGANSTIDPYGVGMFAAKQLKNGDDLNSVITNAMTSLVDQLNPIDNLTSGSITDTPVLSSFGDILTADLEAVKTLVGIGDEDDAQWANHLLSGVFNWLPGSTQAKRVYDTGASAIRGYAVNKKGHAKYDYDPTVGHILQGLAFGTNATPAGQEYVTSGYHGYTDKDLVQIKDRHSKGGSWADAFNGWKADKKLSAEESEIKERQSWGEGTKEDEARLKEIRESRDTPNDASAFFMEHSNAQWAQKAKRLYDESGFVTYPTKMTFKDDKTHGKYFQYNKQKYPISDQLAEVIEAQYNHDAQKIIMSYDDAETISKKLNSLKTKIKEKYIGGE